MARNPRAGRLATRTARLRLAAQASSPTLDPGIARHASWRRTVSMGADVNDLLDRVRIAPSGSGLVIRDAVIHLLSQAGIV